MPSTKEEKEQYEKQGAVIKPSSSMRYVDPCYKEARISYDCLAANRYNNSIILFQIFLYGSRAVGQDA